MQNFDGGVEALAKAGDGLRRQANFRHHHQRLFALSEDVFQYAEIDLCFTGTRNARQQPGRKAVRRAVDGANGGGLFGIETQPIATDGVMGAPVAKAGRFARQLAQSFLRSA